MPTNGTGALARVKNLSVETNARKLSPMDNALNPIVLPAGEAFLDDLAHAMLAQCADEFAAGDSGDIGVRNILRYAFGLDPYDPDVQGGAPRIEIVDGRFGVMFRKPASITDMNYIVLSSDDLRTWTSSDVEPAPTGKNDAELMFYRSKRPLSEAGKQFLLINVEKKP